MAGNIDAESIRNELLKKTEMDPYKHDGSYELMKATVEAYAEMGKLSELDYKELNHEN